MPPIDRRRFLTDLAAGPAAGRLRQSGIPAAGPRVTAFSAACGRSASAR